MKAATLRGANRVRAVFESSVVARFASWGVVNTLVDFGLYVALYSIGVAPIVANLISTTAGLIVSFVGNKQFVFRSSGSTRSEVTRFVVVAGTGIWIIQPAVILLATHGLDAAAALSTPVVGAIAKIVAIAIAAFWNYLLYSRFVFASRPAKSEDGDLS